MTALVAVALTSWRWSVALGEGDEEKRAAIARELLARADGLLDTDPRSAIQLALAAHGVAGGDDTRAGLHETLARTGYAGSLAYEGALRAVAFSPTGERIAVGNDNGDVFIEERPRPGRPGQGRDIVRHGARVNAVAFAPDSRTLAAAGDDGRILLWDISGPGGKPTEPRELPGQGKPVNAIAFAPDSRTLVTVGEDGRVLFWDVSDPSDLRIRNEHVDHHAPVNAVAFAPDGRTLATGGDDQKIILWDLADPNQPRTIPNFDGLHSRPVTAVAFRPDGERVAAGEDDGTVLVWDTTGGGQASEPVVLDPLPTEYAGAVTGLAYAADGRLVTADGGRAVRVRDAEAPQWFGRPISDHGNLALGVAVGPDGKTLAVASQNGSVLLWNLTPDDQPHSLGGLIPNAHAADMIYTADGSTLFAATDTALRIWDVAKPSNPQELAPVTDLDGFGKILETTMTGDRCGGPDAPVDPRVAAPWCRLAIAGSEGRVKIFDMINVRKPVLLADFPAHPGTPVHDMQFSEDGRLLVTGAVNGKISMWAVADPRRPQQVGPDLTGHVGAVRDVQFDEVPEDPDILATVGDDNTVRLWDVTRPESPRPLAVLSDPQGPVNDVQFSGDGRALFAASDDGNVWRWDVRNELQPVSLGRLPMDPGGPVYDQTLADHILVTAGEDQPVRFWDISDVYRPRELGPVITAHFGAIVDMNRARHANRIATAGEDGTIRLWDVKQLQKHVPADVVERACTRTDGGLGRDDWARHIPDLPYEETC